MQVSSLIVSTRSRVWSHLALIVTVSLLAGCAVGPDFKTPAAPAASRYTAQSLPADTASSAVPAGAAQHFLKGRDIPGDWWTLFHSRSLNTLIEQSLTHNPDLKVAQAALRVAHENTLAGHGVKYPSVNADLSANRVQDAPNDSGSIYKLFTPQLSISYVLDLFGMNRRTVESLEAQEQSTRYQMIAAYNTLTANVVVAAIQVASLQKQIDASRQMVDINAATLKILHYQLKQGYASGIDVAAQQSQMAQVEATLPPLIAQWRQQQNLLAALSGRFPSQAPTRKFELSSLHLPEDLPLSLPSKLVQQRPDVLQAQADMHAASAQIGVAVASRLPNIELTGNVGSTTLAIDQVFKSGTGFWNIGAAISAPIFQGGSLLHQERAAKAAYVQAAEQYRSTVLTAFQNVADTLTALQQDAETLKVAAAAADAAKLTLDLSQRQLKDGYISHLSLLNAEQAWLQAHITLVQAQSNRYLDTAVLFQALGGGWWHNEKLSQATASQVSSMPVTGGHASDRQTHPTRNHDE